MQSKIVLGDIASFSNGKTSPNRSDLYSIPVFGANGIIGYSEKENADENLIVIGRVGSYCGSLYFSKSKSWITDNAIKCKAKVDNEPQYIYYLLKTLNLNKHRIGSGQPLLNQGILKSLKINDISVNNQKKIANILSTLDDKIELNHKMNQTLEDMAQALFKSWFVDFEPVHALANMGDEDLETVANNLGISKEILELFPCEFEDSDLGMIPKGWSNDNLGNFVEILDAKRIPMSKMEREKKKGNIPYYGATSIMDYVDDYLFDEPLTLMGEDGSVSRADGTPFMQYIWNKSWVNNHAHVLKGKTSLSTEAIYILLLKQNVTQFITGAVQPKINQGNLKKIPVINPNNILYEKYSEFIVPIFAKIRLIIEEIQTLQKTRDTLLPKLLSGEIEV